MAHQAQHPDMPDSEQTNEPTASNQALEEVESSCRQSLTSGDDEKTPGSSQWKNDLEKVDTQNIDNDDPNNALGYTRSRQSQPERCQSRTSIPFGFTAGLGEENFDGAGDVEKQKVRNERSAADGSEKDPNLVEWNGPDDPGNPLNWPMWKKWVVTAVMGLSAFVCTFTSSVFSTATRATAENFHVSPEVMTLGTALVLGGYSIAPALWGPISEVVGRKIPMLLGLIGLAIFTIPVAVAENVQTILVCRFFVGIFACAPLTVVGGAMNDFFSPTERGLGITVFAAATFVGPSMGPIIGGFVTESYLGWRWTQYLTIIMAGLMIVLMFIFVPESFGPVLLSRRAKRIRYSTRNWAIHAKADESEIDFKEIASKYLLKPFKMLILEPILLLMTLYLSLIYGIIYLLFEALPISFGQERQWSLGRSGLPFLSLLIGTLIGCFITAWLTHVRYNRIVREKGRAPPEERLVPMMLGGIVLPAGAFWFAWTSNPHINPWPSIIALAPVGLGIQMIFQQIINYIVDCYLWQANSALAANTIVRSLVACGFTMFATGLYHNLGVPWATSLLAFLCLAMAPIPFVFYVYGAKIRKLSKFAPFM